MSYLFVHFREKYTEDGEQVYFALSKDGYCWERVNDDGKICFLLDFYDCERKENMRYVPFVMDSLNDVRLNMAKDKFRGNENGMN